MSAPSVGNTPLRNPLMLPALLPSAHSVAMPTHFSNFPFFSLPVPVAHVHECVILESDILWGAFPATAEHNYRDYRNLWLRVAKNVGQNGRSVVLCGTAIPEQFEACPERRYFSTLHYLAMVCDDQLLEERLKQRPAWRQSGSAEYIEGMIQFNRWLKEHASSTCPPMTLFDTSHRSIIETVRDVAQWIRQRL